MKKTILYLALMLCVNVNLFGQLEPNFTEQTVATIGEIVTSFKILPNGIIYAATKSGKVKYIEANGTVGTLLDIQNEVLNVGDLGLLGIEIDPEFASNGYFYLYYTLDYNFFIDNNDLDNIESGLPSINKVVKYQASSLTGFKTLVSNSKVNLIGENLWEGIPQYEYYHAGGGLSFSHDSNLMVSTGDGGYLEAYFTSTNLEIAIQRGIITEAQKAGTYRVQNNNVQNGKILKINPSNGNGAVSNPFYNASAPKSSESRMYGKGLRNPWKNFSYKQPDNGIEKTLIGDVGSSLYEELNLVNQANQNFGWPFYEGNGLSPFSFPFANNNPYPNQLGPILQYRDNEVKIVNNNIASNIPSGSTFHTDGAAIGGITQYKNTDFPTEYQNQVFIADNVGRWINKIELNSSGSVVSSKAFFKATNEWIFDIQSSPNINGLFYAGENGVIKKIVYNQPVNNAPVAKIKYDKNHGTSPLNISFIGNESYDNENQTLTYTWNFGDGTTEVGMSPSHKFESTSKQPFKVKLTVADALGLTHTDSVMIYINNSPPTINATSLDGISQLNLTTNYALPLSANVSDIDAPNTATWKVYLHHNGHAHLATTLTGFSTSTTLSAIDCSELATYFYEVVLSVKDSYGLESIYKKNIYPICTKTPQTLTFNSPIDLPTNASAINLTAVASSGLPITFYPLEGPVSITGSTMSILSPKPGKVIIRATQHGNATYQAAVPIDHEFTLYRNIDHQTVSINAIATKYKTDLPFVVTSSASSGLAPTCYVASGPGNMVNNLVTLTGETGVLKIRCYHAGHHTLNGAFADIDIDVVNCLNIVQIPNETIFNSSNYEVKSSSSIVNLGIAKIQASQIHFKAQQYIDLVPGFETTETVTFSAQIATCDN